MDLVAREPGKYYQGYQSLLTYWSNAIDHIDDAGNRHMRHSYSDFVFRANFHSVTNIVHEAPLALMYQNEDELAIQGLATRKGLGSVHYRNGLRRHDYNGVYHAKIEGSVSYDELPDPRDGNANAVNTNGCYGIHTPGGVLRTPTTIFLNDGSACWNVHTEHGRRSSFTDVEGDFTSLYGLVAIPRRISYVSEDGYAYLFIMAENAPVQKGTYWSSVRVFTTTLGKGNADTAILTDRTYGFRMSEISDQYASYLYQNGLIPGASSAVTTDFLSALKYWEGFSSQGNLLAFAHFIGLDTPFTGYAFYGNRNMQGHGASYATLQADAAALHGAAFRLETQFSNSITKRKPNYADLAYKAYQDIGMWSGNGIMYISDAAHLAEQTRSFVKVAQSLGRSLKGNKLIAACKSAAKLYLSFHYGWRLMVSDTRALCATLSDAKLDVSTRKCQASETFVTTDNRGNTWNVTARYQLFYNAITQMDNLFFEFLHLVDAVPDLENIWDMIPYSFVVDWFIKLGDLFAAMDNFHELCSRYDVEAAGQSAKYTRALSSSELGLSDFAHPAVNFSVYMRGYSSNATIPVPSSLVTSTNPLTHSVEAGALLVSK